MNTIDNNTSNKRIVIRYDFSFFVIEVQLDNNEIGIIIAISNIKYIDNPSIPKWILKISILWYSRTNWNWFVLKSYIENINMDIHKARIEVCNAPFLMLTLLNCDIPDLFILWFFKLDVSGILIIVWPIIVWPMIAWFWSVTKEGTDKSEDLSLIFWNLL